MNNPKPLNPKKWTKEEMSLLYQMKEKGKNWAEISKAIGKSERSVSRKYVRTDWEIFTKDPDGYFSVGSSREWTHSEMNQLFAYLNAKQSYSFIAEKLDRSIISVERKSQTTDWVAWEKALGQEETIDNIKREELEQGLVDALVTLSRHDFKRLDAINEKTFTEKINLESRDFPVPFNEIKKRAEEELESLGIKNPETVSYGEGIYVVVGDSHGKHTKSEMFKLLKKVSNHLNPKKIIHMGHLLDDDNDISYDWGKIPNLVVLAKKEELKLIQNSRNKYDFNFDVVRGAITLGEELVVLNQDLITDYVKTPISSIDQEIFDDKVIINSHRLEFASKTTDDGASYVVSPGCLCDKHIVKTIKQIDFQDNMTVKVAYHDGFTKYRRMGHMNNFWKQGLLVVNVDKQGNHTIVPCLIRKDKKKNEYITSYFDKIITSSGVKNPKKKVFVYGDSHSPNHDSNVIDILESICKDYAPHATVNIGDGADLKGLNHHDREKRRVIFTDILDDNAKTYYVLKRQAEWSKESHIIIGNHERFSRDFIGEYPQFASYLDVQFMCGLNELGYITTGLKEVLNIDGAKFIHGDMIMFNQAGSKLEKCSRTFGENIFIGHIHMPGIRFGCYSIGCSCNLDQGYNEPNASAWMHGFGMCNYYGGFIFPTTIAIENKKCVINGKTYKPTNPKSWEINKYKAKIVYDFS